MAISVKQRRLAHARQQLDERIATFTEQGILWQHVHLTGTPASFWYHKHPAEDRIAGPFTDPYAAVRSLIAIYTQYAQHP